MIGQTISHYRILEKLGEGGMGVVYKAEDLKLGRAVALKFLPSHSLESEEHKARFLQEARAAARLDHPNICTVFEIDEADGKTFLAMACLEGQTLKQKIAERPLPLGEALDIAAQIGRGLQAAHEKGIVHRDIKPANIMITPQGQAKIMDFGLAQLSDRTKLTATGTKLGTPAYMSPEQTEGKAADRRSDLWSLGAVLYEMVSGHVPFVGEADAAVAYAVVHTEPEPLTALRTGLPIALDRVIRKALAKAPGDRYQHVDDFLVDLASFAHEASRSSPLPARSRREWVAWGLAAACAAIAVSLWFRPEPTKPAIWFVLDAADEGFRAPGAPALSPDGSLLAFPAAGEDGRRGLWVRPLAERKSRMLPGTEGAANLFWSPDGLYLGFTATGKLRRIPVRGGPADAICDAPGGRGGTWNRTGDVIFQPDSRLPLFRVPAAGGTAVPLTRLDAARNENSHRYPRFLPDGRRFLFTVRASPEHTGIYAASLDSPEARKILAVPSSAVYSPGEAGIGHLLFVRDGTLYAQEFDERSLALHGDPRVIAQGVRFSTLGSSADFDVSSDGRTLVYRAGETDVAQLTWFDRSGRQLGQVGPRDVIVGARLSPDMERVAFSMTDPFSGTRDLWMLDFSSQVPQRITVDPNNDWQPVWSADGRKILFNTDRMGGVSKSYITAPAGGPAEPLLSLAADNSPMDWSADGTMFVFWNTEGVWLKRLGDDSDPVRFLDPQFSEIDAKLSPDGKWVAYPSNRSGNVEIYLRAVDAADAGGRQVSVGGGTMPRWRRDGKELFYRAMDGSIFSVEIPRPGEPAQPGKLFQSCLTFRAAAVGWWESEYDVAADGQRFLVQCPAVDENSTKIHVVVNWQELLKRQDPLR